MDSFTYENEIRRERGYLTLEEMMALRDQGTVFLSLSTTLISNRARLGIRNIFYPNVHLEADADGVLEIGDGNQFYQGTTITAAAGGTVQMGNGNLFRGGVSLIVNRPGASISIGNHGRYMDGVKVYGATLGSGSQLLGGLSIMGCTLEAGESYTHPDPDMRAGLIKGTGEAKNMTIQQGEVLFLQQIAVDAKVQRQSDFHPKK